MFYSRSIWNKHLKVSIESCKKPITKINFYEEKQIIVRKHLHTILGFFETCRRIHAPRWN